MPELAEVEYNRKQWDPGLGDCIHGLAWHPRTRVFRGIDSKALKKRLIGSHFRESKAHGKQMVFLFSGNLWLGVHLGMTGCLEIQPPDFQASRHDHLVLQQQARSMVFRDPRQFGRILFHDGPGPPPWWTHLPPALTSPSFTHELVAGFLRRHARLPIKAALLLQDGFPGVGNWMADEILWRSRLHPRTRAGRISPSLIPGLWRQCRWVSHRALATIGRHGSDPPRTWLFQHRWQPGGHCPRDGTPLGRDTIGGRTTAWCPQCQKNPPNQRPKAHHKVAVSHS